MTISSAKVRCGIMCRQLPTHDLLSAAGITFPALADIDFTNGTGDNQADGFWGDERTLAASASEELDLSGSLTDIFGVTVAAAKLRAFMIEADENNNAANNLIVGNAAATQFQPFLGGVTQTLILFPGARVTYVNKKGSGLLVTAGA
ncbi:MAG: hypothetical protein MN733_10225, partial [Nitrososphaera sp.]|nr:hypothetical protein [Nitrososphaera sp.]